MAEAAAIIGIVNGAGGLIIKCTQVAQALNDLQNKYKLADLSIKLLIQNVGMIQHAWEQLRLWCESSSNDECSDRVGSNLRLQLEDGLTCGDLVIAALKDDLEHFYVAKEANRLSFRLRTKFVWNQASIEAHRNRLRDQISIIQMLLQIINLPSSPQRDDLIAESQRYVAELSESALSIIPSNWSFGSRRSDTASTQSIELKYERLDFEDSLFTARVYKRNYQYNARRPEATQTTQQSAEKGVNEGEIWLPENPSGNTGSSTIGDLLARSNQSADATSIITPLGDLPIPGDDSHAVLRLQLPTQSNIANLITSKERQAFEKACKDNDIQYIRQQFLGPPSGFTKRQQRHISVKASYFLCTATQTSSEILGLLLDMGWGQYAKMSTEKLSSPLDVAIYFNDETAISMLLKHTALLGCEGIMAGSASDQLIHSSPEILQALIDKLIDAQRPSSESLSYKDWLARWNHVLQVIEKGSQALGEKLCWNKSFLEFVKSYMTQDVHFRTLVEDAVSSSHIPALRIFSLWNITAALRDRHEHGLLHRAVNHNSKSALEFLLKDGFRPDNSASNDRRPIHDAIIWNLEEMTRLLVVAGADLTIKDRLGVTPLHYAAKLKQSGIPRQITALRSDLSWCCTDKNGQQPIHYAASIDNLGFVKFLIFQGVFPFEEDDRGQTPAHVAILNDAIDVICFYIEASLEWDGEILKTLHEYAVKEHKLKARILIEAVTHDHAKRKWTQPGQTPLASARALILNTMTDEDKDLS